MTDIMQLPKWQRFDEVQRKKAQKHLVYGAGVTGLAASGMGAARWGARNAGSVVRDRPQSVLGRAARVARGAKFGRALGATSAAAGLLGAGSTLTWGASLGREIKRDEAKLRQQNLVKAAFMSDEEFEKAFGLGAAKTLGSKMWKPLKAAGSNAAAGWRGAAPAKGLNGLKAAGVRAQGAGQAAWGGMSQPMKYGTVGVLGGGAGLGLSQLNKASKRSMAQEALLANPEFQAGYARQMGEQTANAEVARSRSKRRRKRLVKLGALGLIGYGAYRSGVFKADDWRGHVSPEALEGYRYLKRGERDKKQLAAGPFVGTAAGAATTAATAGATGAFMRSVKRDANAMYPGYDNRWRGFPKAVMRAHGKNRVKGALLLGALAAPTALTGAYTAAHASRIPAARRQWQEANRWRDKAGKIQARGEQRMALGKALNDQQRLSLAPAAGGVAGAGLLASGLRGRSGVRLSEFDWLQPPGPGNKSFNFSIKTRGAGRKGRKLADQKLRDLYDVLDSHKIGQRAADSSRELVGSVYHKPFLGRPGRAAAGAALLAGSAALAPAAVRQWRGRREVGKSLVEVSKWGAKIHPVSRIAYGYEGETPDTIAMRSDGRTMFGRNKYRTMVVPGEQYGKDKGMGVYRISPNAFKLSRRQRRMLKGRAKDISGLKTDYSGVKKGFFDNARKRRQANRARAEYDYVYWSGDAGRNPSPAARRALAAHRRDVASGAYERKSQRALRAAGDGTALRKSLEPVSKWTEIKDRQGNVALRGGYYGDMDNPEAGKPYTYSQKVKRKKLLGLINRKPKVVQRTVTQGRSYPVLRYADPQGRSRWVLPQDVNPKTFDRTKVRRVGADHPNRAKFDELGLSKAAPQLRVKPLIMRGSPVRRGTFVRKPVGQMTYRRGSL